MPELICTKPAAAARAAAGGNESKPVRLYSIPSESADPVALIPLGVVSVIVSAGKSYIFDEIREGRFPRPVIQRPRFTRWRLGDVREWARDPAAWTARTAA